MEEEEDQLETFRQSSLFLNSGSLIIFSIVVLTFLTMPSFLSFTSQIFRPDHLVKKSWDFLNLVLVVFAVLCGFLGRNTGEIDKRQCEDYHSPSNRPEQAYRSNSLDEHQWHLYSDRKENSLRNSSSYPDLRRESSWDERWRSYDDTRFLNSPHNIDEKESKTRSDTSATATTTKEFMNSSKRKKKGQRRKSFENFQTLISTDHRPWQPIVSPVFYQNHSSSKKGRTKKVNSTPPSHSPSPKTENCPDKEESDGFGSESTIPPPPPLPPFRMAEWEFDGKGDFISIKSNSNSPRRSPDLNDGEGWPWETVGSEISRGTDVNTEAESFIAKFRAGLKLEKMSCEKATQKSNLF